MPLLDLIELLNGAVVVEIIKMVERRTVQRVVGTKRQTFGWFGYFASLRSRCRGQEHQAEKQTAMSQRARKQMGLPRVRSGILSLSDACALGARESRTSIRHWSLVVSRLAKT